ncbi:MAG: DNA (cytosine-5-)-methyltransferase [Dehalococcoidia bacterium]
MRFIDLFAGLGGFHLALRELGHSCVFASEMDEELRNVYERNFSMRPAGDIREVDEKDVPEHDILCAGFPCQPFSKAGSQDGFGNPELGRLYQDILRIIEYRRPRYVMLENVPNLERHDSGKSWKRIQSLLNTLGYDVRLKKLSPHHFGIPQIRERIYIVGSQLPLKNFSWPEPISEGEQISIKSILERNPPEARKLTSRVRECLTVWQEFLNTVPDDEPIPHPLWSMEFGATYPYEDKTPHSMSTKDLRVYAGSHGAALAMATSRQELLKLLPSHARTEQPKFPAWKIRFIEKNREFYFKHRKWIDHWIPKIKGFPSSFQKLEWNCQGEKIRRLDHYVIQLRASGVRVKRATTAPSLVAMTATQVPIITWEGRYMTPKECKHLQSMGSLMYLPTTDTKVYQALGNAINVKVAEKVAEALVGRSPVTSQRSSIKRPVATHH